MLGTTMANASPTPSFALTDTTQKAPLLLVPQATNDGLHIVPTTEPLSEADITAMRRRIHEMGIVSSENGHASSREKEMADMVLRLTASSLIDPTQLLSQAATISGLTSQRNFVIRQAEEERGRWQSERDGWDRTAEALIAQRNKPGSSAAKDEEFERRCAAYESDNRALRDKLYDANNRLMTLESELNKLKPILLMQPYPRGDDHTNIPSQSLKHALARSKKDEETIEDIIDEVAEGNKSNPPTASASTSDIYKRRDAVAQHPYPYNHSYQAPRHTAVAQGSQQQPLPTASSSRILWQPPNLNPSSATDPPRRVRLRRRIIPSLSSDARTEHILLAARKIGRERASVVSGLAHYADKEKAKWVRDQEQQRLNREAERLEKERLERLASGNAGASYYRRDAEFASPTQKQTSNTPKRSGLSHYAPIITGIRPPRKSASQTTFVFVGNSGEPVGGVETATRSDATPRRDREEETNQKAGGGPPTPMDSLLSAARSMMDEGGKSNGRRRAGPLEHSESPAPKKRRVAGSKGPSHGRAKSALDVLADQAAVANEAGSSSASAPRAGGKRASAKAKGKEKEKEGDVGDGKSKTGNEDQQVMAKPKGRPKNSKKVAPTPVLVASGKKARPPRAPPRDRTGNNNHTSSNPTQTLRMISPPGPRIISAPDGRRGRMYSPLDEALAPLPSKLKGKEKAANREPEHVWVDSGVGNQRPSTAFSFGPVVGWGERVEGDGNDEHDGSSSPIMPEPSRPRYDPVLDAARVVESSSLQKPVDVHPTEKEGDHRAGSHQSTSPRRMNGVAAKVVPSGSITIETDGLKRFSQEEDQAASTRSLEGTHGVAVDAVESRSLLVDVEKHDQSQEVEVDAATVVEQNGVDGDKDEQNDNDNQHGRDKRNDGDEQNDRNENSTEDKTGGNRLGDAHRSMNHPRSPTPLPGPPLRELDEDYDDEHDGDADAEGEIDPEASDAAQESAMAI